MTTAAATATTRNVAAALRKAGFDKAVRSHTVGTGRSSNYGEITFQAGGKSGFKVDAWPTHIRVWNTSTSIYTHDRMMARYTAALESAGFTVTEANGRLQVTR